MENGAASGDFVVTVTLPSSIVPGTFHPQIDCSDGTSTSVTLRVTQMPSGGGAQTGDGTTSTTTNTGLAVGGLVAHRGRRRRWGHRAAAAIGNRPDGRCHRPRRAAATPGSPAPRSTLDQL